MAIIFEIQDRIMSSGQQKIDLQAFVILFALLVFVLIIIHEGADIIAPGWKSWAISTIVLLLGSNTGAFRILSDFLIGLSSLIGLLDEYKIFSFLFALLIVILFSYFLLKFLKVLKNKTAVDEMGQIGRNINTQNKIAKIKIKAGP